ncbi:MAG TPA: SelT/SelW/SelH family protein [Gemmatimonadaceae bacterium]
MAAARRLSGWTRAAGLFSSARMTTSNGDVAGPRAHGVPRVEITYCPRCRWLLRAAWMAQELLVTFERELGEVALRPGDEGVYEVRLDGTLIWSRLDDGGFPEPKELKQRIRDRIAPDRSLGHSDRSST